MKTTLLTQYVLRNLTKTHKRIITCERSINSDVMPPSLTMDQMVESLKIHLNSCKPPSKDYQPELQTKTMKDSRTRGIVPLSSSIELRNLYLSANGRVRIGRLFEDLDKFAVYISYKHNLAPGKKMEDPGSLPRTIVTAAVDRIDLHNVNINPQRDIQIIGKITWAGRTSMEASMTVFQLDENNIRQKMWNARFVMVARDVHKSCHAVQVHPLRANSPEEITLYKQGEAACKDRKTASSASLLKSYPTEEEMRYLHSMFLKSMRKKKDSKFYFDLDDNQVWLHSTRQRCTRVCWPENQNMYGKIFGGYLMREAIELAYATAKIFCKGSVIVVSVDDISFWKPVEIGNILKLESLITFTDGPYMQARVLAETYDDSDAHLLTTTNIFHFTLKAINSPMVDQVIPKYYEHGSLLLNGRRHLQKALKRIEAEKKI